MLALELHLLKRFCDKHGLDYQEIDDSLTYWENKAHLLELVQECSAPLVAEFNRAADSAQEQYMKEHALSYYIACSIDGETVSSEMGPPWKHRFSLADYIRAT